MALKSIKDKALAFYAALFLSIAVFVTALSYFIMLNYLNKVQREKLETDARQLAKNIQYRMVEKENLFRIITDGKAVEVFSVTYQEPMLAEYFSGFKNEFPVLSFVNYEGMEELKIEQGVASKELLDVKGVSAFQDAVVSPGSVFSVPVEQGAAKEPSVVFARAGLSYFDEPLGVVMGEVPLKVLARDIREYRFGEKGSALLLDSYGNMLSHGQDEMVFRRIDGKGEGADEIIKKIRAHKEYFGRADLLGVDAYVACAPVANRDWTVMAVFPYEEFVEVPNALRNTVLIVFFSLLLVGLPVVLYLVVGITGPLNKLVTATDAIAQGDLSQRVDIKSVDEVGMLGRSFNVMAEALKASREELEKSNESLRKLSAHMLTVREEERKTIAREVHDELGQLLSTIKLDLAWIKKRLPEDARYLEEKINAASGLIDMTIETVQKITSELRPLLLDDLGLAAAVEWQTAEFANRTGMECKMDILKKEPPLVRTVTDSLFRVYQEAMVNVARHSGATKVRVSLKEQDGRLVMEIEDNGRGITEDEMGSADAFGLMGMKERINLLNGTVAIEGAKDVGTKVIISIPLNTDREGAR